MFVSIDVDHLGGRGMVNGIPLMGSEGIEGSNKFSWVEFRGPEDPYDVALSKGIKPKIKVQEERGHKGPLEPLVVVVGPGHWGPEVSVPYGIWLNSKEGSTPFNQTVGAPACLG